MAKSKDPVEKAMQHPDVPGAGAKARANLGKANTAKAVMKEFNKGTLRAGGSGKVVTNPAQAKAIARSESEKKKRG